MDGELVVVATPAYLKRAGTPRTLEDLAQHDCVQFVLPSSGQAIPWIFRRDGADVDVPTQGGYSCNDDVLALATLARAGAGLVQIYRFTVEDALKAGALVEVLKPFGGRSWPFSLIYPGGRHMPLRVRVFIDYLVDELKPL